MLTKYNGLFAAIDDAESADGEHGGASGRTGGWDHHDPGARHKPGSVSIYFGLLVLHSLAQSVTHGCDHFFLLKPENTTIKLR